MGEQGFGSMEPQKPKPEDKTEGVNERKDIRCVDDLLKELDNRGSIHTLIFPSYIKDGVELALEVKLEPVDKERGLYNFTLISNDYGVIKNYGIDADTPITLVDSETMHINDIVSKLEELGL